MKSNAMYYEYSEKLKEYEIKTVDLQNVAAYANSEEDAEKKIVQLQQRNHTGFGVWGIPRFMQK